MTVTLSDHYGMCFGVRDALRATHALAEGHEVTVLGQLVHNRLVDVHLEAAGVRRADLGVVAGGVVTRDVVITAHGASEGDRRRWAEAGHRVTDTTCPLVRKAHRALACLVAAGFHPVVVGRAGHVEVRGLVGDFPWATVVETAEEVVLIPAEVSRIGVVAQTTQPVGHVRAVVEAVRAARPGAEVVFRDTVCQPTKDRQAALERLCAQCEVVVVVGGSNSNNTGKLVETARRLGAVAYHVESAETVDPGWFRRGMAVGVTAGTSTLDETVDAVCGRLRQIAADKARPGGLAGWLRRHLWHI